MKNMEQILGQNGVKIAKREGVNGEVIIGFPGTSLQTYGELRTAPITEVRDIDVALTEALVAYALIHIKEVQKTDLSEDYFIY